jgi:transcriptional regulator with XRE-family HTH domain
MEGKGRVMRVVGENVKRLRTRRGLNQAELSMLSGLSRFTISKIEARPMENPHGSTLRKLAAALGCTVEDLWEELEEHGDGPVVYQGHVQSRPIRPRPQIRR